MKRLINYLKNLNSYQRTKLILNSIPFIAIGVLIFFLIKDNFDFLAR